jgi:hypothetical protein
MILLKFKSGIEVANAFKNINKSKCWKSKLVWSDKGPELCNENVLEIV